MGGYHSLWVLIWKNMENSGKTADLAGLGKYSMGGYGRIGVYRVNLGFNS